MGARAMNSVAIYAPSNFSELDAFCQRITRSGMVPQAYKNKPEDAAIAVMWGSELGLPPLQSLNAIAVINGRPAIWGDALPGLALSKGHILDIQESFEGKEDTDAFTAVCVVTRPSGSLVTQRFSVADAKKAGLWGKQGPWQQYSRRMLQLRARSWAIRDAAPHLTFGPAAEELRDIPLQTAIGPDKARDITPPAEPAASPHEEVETALGAQQTWTVVDQDGAVVATVGSKRDALAAYGEVKQQPGQDPRLAAIANLDLLRALLPHTSNGVRTRLGQEIEAAEAAA